MASKKQARPVYTTDYYRLEKLVSSSEFEKKVRWLRSEYEKAGCPLPDKPFETYREYEAWLKLFWEQHMNAEYAKMKEPITPGQFLEDRLYEAKLDHRNPKYKEFLMFHVFLGRPHLLERAFDLLWMRVKPTDDPKLFIQLMPHTKKEDIEAHWGDIAKEIRRLPGYIGKSKQWESSERDFEVYDEYKRLREASGRKRAANSWQSVDKWVYSELHEKHPELTASNIRAIVARTRKRLGEI